jgi:hypothetical protein
MATNGPDHPVVTDNETTTNPPGQKVLAENEKTVSPDHASSDLEAESHAINTTALLRKLDLRLLPPLSLLYLLSFLDRSNGSSMANSKLESVKLTLAKLPMPVSRVSPPI